MECCERTSSCAALLSTTASRWAEHVARLILHLDSATDAAVRLAVALQGGVLDHTVSILVYRVHRVRHRADCCRCDTRRGKKTRGALFLELQCAENSADGLVRGSPCLRETGDGATPAICGVVADIIRTVFRR